MLQRFNEKNRNLIVNVNGKLTHRDEAAVSPFDSAVQGGDAVWEGLRLYNGRVFKLREHLDRLRGWLIVPSNRSANLPAISMAHGYAGGRNMASSASPAPSPRRV